MLACVAVNTNQHVSATASVLCDYAGFSFVVLDHANLTAGVQVCTTRLLYEYAP